MASIPRIYINQPITAKQVLQLDKSASNHVVKVLRLRVNAPLVVFNGQGGEYDAVLTDANAKAAQVQVQQQRQPNVESPLHIHLAQGLSRGERMDYVVQKAVELGVTSITPLFTEYCQVKLSADRIAKRLEHWQGVIISACEQSGRVYIPTINTPMTYTDYLEKNINNYLLVCDPLSKDNISSFNKPKDNNLNLIIGPEGGLSEKEIQKAVKTKCYRLCLGPRTLRTETATVAALTVVQSYWGDLGS